MGTPGQSWPYIPSASAQVDYWDLDFLNQEMTDEQKEKKKQQIIQARRQVQRIQREKDRVKRLESDMFAKNKVARLEDDFWGKNKKKSKPLNSAERILKRIL